MESVLKVFGHEMGQITPGLDAVRIRYFSPPATINKLTDNKIEDINCDLKGLLSQLYFIGGRAKQLITGSPDVNKTEFWAFKQLLYKWQNTFKPTTRGKRIKILVYDVRMDDPLRPMVYGDVYLLEQLLYNFISNAIKYAYRGTNILLDCMLNNEKTHHVLTVTNYGIDIGEDRKILDLFQRGKNVEGEEGLGIGLFLARKIAIAHGGDVDFERDLVSDYNVPLIQNYLTINKYSSVRWKVDESILESLKLIKQELEVTDKYWQIVSKNDGGTEYYKSTIGETIISLKKPTYKVTLKAYIPTKGLST
jgi:signal transduction histidine kinase